MSSSRDSVRNLVQRAGLMFLFTFPPIGHCDQRQAEAAPPADEGETLSPVQRHRADAEHILPSGIPSAESLERHYQLYLRRAKRNWPTDQYPSVWYKDVWIGLQPLMPNLGQQCREFHDYLAYDKNGDSDNRCYRLAGMPLIDKAALDRLSEESSVSTDTFGADSDYDPFHTDATYQLVPAYAVTDGAQIALAAFKSADSRLLFNCGTAEVGDRGLYFSDGAADSSDEYAGSRDSDTNSGSPDSVTQTEYCRFLTKASDMAGTTISVCEVWGGVERDPPRACTPFVVYRRHQAWIAILDSYVGDPVGEGLEGIGPPRPDLTVALFLKSGAYAPNELLGNALSSPPLNLIVANPSRNSVSGAAPQRLSGVLSPYKEWVYLLLHIDDCPSDKIPDFLSGYASYCISSVVNLQVNKGLNEDRRNWAPASNGQIAGYVSAFRTSLQAALKSVCHVVSVRGDRFVCD
jgi:hypothetical protein